MQLMDTRLIALSCIFYCFFFTKELLAGPVYRCPGPTPLYTDNLQIEEARERKCVELIPAPITIFSPRQRPGDTKFSETKPARPQSESAASPPSSSFRIQQSEQSARDTDAKLILQEELQNAEKKLSELQAEFKGGNPDRQPGERNYQRYLDRVEQMRQNISLKSADIEAIKRELSKIK